ncbi:hypothetical protein [uncultured Algibacter sp.]|uniref:hypothetical protein n=1 Tax=uncultured Algibacter sp. TaxID=298659 RepID=UPI002619A009|nr:hypothetical protein [uncultured Algibacter sp.]
MFKALLHKLPLIFVLFGIVLCSCDGRKSKNDLLKESIIKFKDSIEPIEIVKYFPKEYEETQTDTILSNGYAVHIKAYVSMKDAVSNEYQIDSKTTIKDVFRKRLYEINVEREGVLIFNKLINTNFFSSHGKIEKLNLSKTIVNNIEVNQELSMQDNLFLTAEIVNVSSEKAKYYKHTFFNIIIDSKGIHQLNKLHTFKNLI